VKLSSPDRDYPFDISINSAQLDDSEVWRPLMMVGGAILGTALSTVSFYLLWKHQEMHFMVRACYVSVMVLSILYFELFGVYIICGLQYNAKYFQYLTVAGIACFLSSLSTNKLSVVFFIFQFANHPQMEQTSWRSPRTRFYLLPRRLLLVQVPGLLLLHPAFLLLPCHPHRQQHRQSHQSHLPVVLPAVQLGARRHPRHLHSRLRGELHKPDTVDEAAVHRADRHGSVGSSE
jgi:hypothetical protein